VDKRPALGKGLSALIPDAAPAAASGMLEVDIDRLTPNELQPRMVFDEEKLDELARSIKARGSSTDPGPAAGRRAIASSPVNAAGAPRNARDSCVCRSSSARSPTDPTSNCSSSR
jgi:hypothetical protein